MSKIRGKLVQIRQMLYLSGAARRADSIIFSVEWRLDTSAGDACAHSVMGREIYSHHASEYEWCFLSVTTVQ